MARLIPAWWRRHDRASSALVARFYIIPVGQFFQLIPPTTGRNAVWSSVNAVMHSTAFTIQRKAWPGGGAWMHFPDEVSRNEVWALNGALSQALWGHGVWVCVMEYVCVCVCGLPQQHETWHDWETEPHDVYLWQLAYFVWSQDSRGMSDIMSLWLIIKKKKKKGFRLNCIVMPCYMKGNIIVARIIGDSLNYSLLITG